jgi:nitroimidazol reductase NimA-like FMN-containing flavoprotein (pyridoxamine 5'-phosphate oxidase superfamily)
MEKKTKKTKTQIRREIIAFLDDTCGLVDENPGKHSCGLIHRNCLVLATSKNNVPRATALEFFNEKMTIYIFAEPGGKIPNLKKNKNVSAAIYEQPMDHSKNQRSLQIFGTAELLNAKTNPRLVKAKAKKWNLMGLVEAMNKKKKIADSIYLVKITPTRAILREFRTDMSSEKFTWEK